MGKVSVRTAAEVSESVLAERKEAQRRAIRDGFAAESAEPLLILGIEWHGGYESASRLETVFRLAERSGDSVVTLYDINNAGHRLSLQEASQVIVSVAAKSQADFARKQAKMQAIDNASTLDELQRII